MFEGPLAETVVLGLYGPTVVDVESEEQVDLLETLPIILHCEK